MTKFLASDYNFDRLEISNLLVSIVIIGDFFYHIDQQNKLGESAMKNIATWTSFATSIV